MKYQAVFASALFAIMALPAFAQPSAPSQPADNAPIVGIWRCQMEGLPAVTLNVTGENGSLTGAVLFYLHRREPGQAVTATPGVPEPLFNLRFDGHTLTFAVSHRRAHPPRTLNDPPVEFELRLNTDGTAQLTNEHDKTDGTAPVYILTHSAY